MLRKTIKFQDLDGVNKEEDFYFHLTKAELIRLQVSQEGGLTENLQAVGKSGKPKLILSVFEEIIRSAYGRRTPSGGFVKREEDWLEFKSSEAYSELFMELVTDASYAAQFVAGIMPANMSSEVEKAVAGMSETVELPRPVVGPADAVDDDRPVWLRENREPTTLELRNMSKDELMAAMQRKIQSNNT